MSEVIPGILEKEWAVIEKKIQTVLPFADAIHIDVLDGIFAENTTFLDPEPFAPYTKKVPFEVHLMVDDPISYIKPFADAGFQRFIGHVERMPDQVAFVARAQEYGAVGLALDAKSSLDAITVPLDDLDFILIMTINAGFSGQKFLPEMANKVQALQKQADIVVEVDGGITDQTIVQAKEAGATRFVTTSFLFFHENPHEAYKILKQSIGSY